ncbi:MAG: hypothetical protein A3G18_03530 [Rhodospirillales bacterium RIFCSPLOWO2_12_FULL_58_28]|nr:MAG: hypothetical protein A3H92_01090 [Rhodospirillales bacterium RIFCSPLOWO2_02_FULL_58_16]OHC76836.1 MAG: hypothetical protein A3G18_03530 [Rhodospirillales bacterium RIFCSPLOWO2_12_FULL_58_28]
MTLMGSDGFVRLCATVAHGRDSIARCAVARALAETDGDAEVVRHLVALLGDDDPNVRMEAAASLGRLRAVEALGSLVDRLERDQDGGVRIEAVKALSNLLGAGAIDPLIRCLRGAGYPDLDYRCHDLDYPVSSEVESLALKALGNCGDERAVEAVIKAVADENNHHLQEAGFYALARLGYPLATDFLLSQLSGGGRSGRRCAAKALVEVDAGRFPDSPVYADVVGGLTAALGDADPSVRVEVIRALAHWGPVTAGDIAGRLADHDPDVQCAAATALVTVAGPKAAADLRKMPVGADGKVRRHIITLLGRCGGETDEAALLSLLDQKDAVRLRREIVEALGNIGGAGGQSRLLSILTTPQEDDEIRLAAVNGLKASLTPAAPSGQHDAAVAALRSAVRDPSLHVAVAAMSVLAKAAPTEVVSLLSRMVQDEVDRLAIRLPANGGNADPTPPETERTEDEEAGDPASSTLASILAANPRREPETGEKSELPANTGQQTIAAVHLLGNLGQPGPDVLVALSAAAASSDDGLRAAALRSLGRLGERNALPLARAGLGAESRDVRIAAAGALAELSGGEAVESVVKILLDNSDPMIRRCAVDALKAMGDKAPPALLIRALGDEDRGICRAALAVIGPESSWPEIGDQLLLLLFNGSDETHGEVVRTLARISSIDAERRLLAIAGDCSSEHLHGICIETLVAMRAAEPGANGKTKCH